MNNAKDASLMKLQVSRFLRLVWLLAHKYLTHRKIMTPVDFCMK
jgi:hypothetical protein